MSQYPAAYSNVLGNPSSRPPGHAPPLPPRRPLSDFWGQNAPPPGASIAQNQNSYSQGTPNGGYGVGTSHQFPPQQGYGNSYTGTPSTSSNIPVPQNQYDSYGQTAYANPSSYGQAPAIQYSTYAPGASPYTQSSGQSYGNQRPIASQYQSPYGQSASPNLSYEPSSQKYSSAPYQAAPSVSNSAFPQPPPQEQNPQSHPYDAQLPASQVSHAVATSPPPPPSSPHPTTSVKITATNSANFQYGQGYTKDRPLSLVSHETSAQKGPQHQYPVAPNTTIYSGPHVTSDSQYSTGTTGSNQYQGVNHVSSQENPPSSEYALLTPPISSPPLPHRPHLSSSPRPQLSPKQNVAVGAYPPVIAGQHPVSPVSASNPYELTISEQLSSPLTAQYPPMDTTNTASHLPLGYQSQSEYSSAAYDDSPMKISTAPTGPTLASHGPKSPPPTLPAKIQVDTKETQTEPLELKTPSVAANEHLCEETVFINAAMERYREHLEMEKVYAESGKSNEILNLLQSFILNEIQIREERYAVPEVSNSTALPAELSSKVKGTEPLSSKPQEFIIVKEPPKPSKPAPPSTFSAILSGTSSYVSPPRSPAPLSPAPADIKAPSPSPPTRKPPPIPSDPEPELANTEEKLPTTKPYREHSIPPVPKSESLEKVLSSIPKSTADDPVLTPLRKRLAALKDLDWVDTNSFEFEERENKVTTDLLEKAQKYQDAHSKRQSTYYGSEDRDAAERADKVFKEDEQHRRESEMKHSLARWRSEYCDPTYEKLHSNFDSATQLHRDITQSEGCEDTEEQVSLLNDTQHTFLDIMSRLDVLTDELRRKQHQLKTSKGSANGDWELIEKFDKEKDEEDKTLKKQRSEFRLDKVRLHSHCVQYLVDYGLEILMRRKGMVVSEVKRILDELPEKATSEELPAQDSTDAYPSEDLIEQIKEAQLVLNTLQRCINSLHALLEENEINRISEENEPAINKSYTSNDWNAGEELRAKQTAQQNDIRDANTRDREARDAQDEIFIDRLLTYITAHNGRRQAHLAAVAYGSGGDSNIEGSPLAKLMQEQRKTQMVGNMVHTMHMSRMSVINNLGSSNTRYEYVNKY